MALGARWKQKFNVPSVLDFQDPWVSDYYERHPERRPPGGRLKYGVSQWLARRLEPRTVVASHFDDFFRPLESPMGFSLNVNLSAFPEEVAAVSSDFAVAALEPMQAVSG